jgi:hypothetical protein
MDQQLPILRALEASDPEIAERLVSRRDALKGGAAASAGLATALRLASAPVALAAFARDAFGQSRLPSTVVNVLNFALTLEYLESEFYVRGVSAGIIPAADLAIFTTIRDHEVAHVNFLVNALGAAARPKPTFDFTAGNGSGTGPYADVFTNYNTFKAVAQAFEDTGVRAYKGQAPALMPYKTVLTQALTIHSVEARHASEVRRLRGNFQDTEPNEGWITFNQTDVPGTAAVYAGEENVVQAGVNVPSVTTVGAKEVSESFDEPLTQNEVLAIVDPFIV